MTATITLSCDGHRHGQTCRGALPTRHFAPGTARIVEGKQAGWRRVPAGDLGWTIDLCPSRGHDEDQT